jgi:hypothetical protein
MHLLIFRRSALSASLLCCGDSFSHLGSDRFAMKVVDEIVGVFSFSISFARVRTSIKKQLDNVDMSIIDRVVQWCVPSHIDGVNNASSVK